MRAVAAASSEPVQYRYATQSTHVSISTWLKVLPFMASSMSMLPASNAIDSGAFSLIASTPITFLCAGTLKGDVARCKTQTAPSKANVRAAVRGQDHDVCLLQTDATSRTSRETGETTSSRDTTVTTTNNQIYHVWENTRSTRVCKVSRLVLCPERQADRASKHIYLRQQRTRS